MFSPIKWHRQNPVDGPSTGAQCLPEKVSIPRRCGRAIGRAIVSGGYWYAAAITGVPIDSLTDEARYEDWLQSHPSPEHVDLPHVSVAYRHYAATTATPADPTRPITRTLLVEYAELVENRCRAQWQQHVQQVNAQRQRIEDIRANRRNRNRFLTLIVALVGATFIPNLMVAIWGPQALKYSFAVTIVPDAFITLYAFIRKY